MTTDKEILATSIGSSPQVIRVHLRSSVAKNEYRDFMPQEFIEIR
jgi:hypothetical protein